MAGPLQLEIAVQDALGAAVAREGGATRVEVCTALGISGGLTPTGGALAQIVAQEIPAHVLIRCRPGSFVYTPAEREVMATDIELSLSAGAAGVVIGALTSDREIDVPATALLVAAARNRAAQLQVPCDITFHRALDVVADPVAALKVLADLGVDRVLTSGGASRSGEGLRVLEMLCAAGTGVQVMAGGGVAVSDISHLAGVGVDAVHLSAKELVADRGPVGPGGGAPGDLEVTSPEIVAAAVREVKLVNAGRSR